MLKTIRSSKLSPKVFKAKNNEVVSGDNNKTNEIVVNSSNQTKNNKSRNSTYMPNIGVTKKPIF